MDHRFIVRKVVSAVIVRFRFSVLITRQKQDFGGLFWLPHILPALVWFDSPVRCHRSESHVSD
jgi:hypothetical protein